MSDKPTMSQSLNAEQYYKRLSEWLEKRVEVLEEENTKLDKRDDFLTALESAGVDNWQGYEHAQDIMEEWENEE